MRDPLRNDAFSALERAVPPSRMKHPHSPAAGNAVSRWPPTGHPGVTVAILKSASSVQKNTSGMARGRYKRMVNSISAGIQTIKVRP